jgi:hypothetical protein
VLVPGDDFFGFVRRGAIDPWLPQAHEQNIAVTEAAAAAAGRLARYCDVVYEGVVGPWFRATFLQQAGVDHFHYAVLFPPRDVCVDRVRTRRGHGFTDLQAADHMWSDFRRATIEPEYVFDDPDADPAELASRISERAAAQSLRYPRPT